MNVHEKSKEELMSELSVLQQRIASLEDSQNALSLFPLIENSDSSSTVFNRDNGCFSPIFNTLPTAMAMMTFPEGRFVATNNSFSRLFGFSREELLKRSVLEMNLWKTNETRDKIWACLKDRRIFQNEETIFRTKSGIEFTALISAELNTYYQQEHILISIVDIPDLKEDFQHSRATLQRQEEELHSEKQQQVLNSLPGLLFLFSKDGEYLNCHTSDSDLMYLPSENLLGKKLIDVLPKEEAEKIMTSIRHVLRSGGAHDVSYQLEINETIHFFEGRTIKYSDNEVLMVVHDMTELIRLRQDMARLDQLNLVGEIAASIGHEVRNPLTTVRGFLQMLGNKKDCEPFKDYFELMIEELDRANMIISEFLSLARNKDSRMQRQSLNNIIQALAPLIQSDAIMYNKFMKMELTDIPDLILDAKEIRQLILNLARNGLEAMDKHAVLIIRTYMEDGKAVLAVQDQGPGIPPELIDKLGTPFFTTKENGTGLGLPVCYNIAVKHKALLEVDTSPQGTTFFIKFTP